MSAPNPASTTNSPSSAAAATTINPPLAGPAPTRAFITSLVASGEFYAAGANYADLVEIDREAAVPDLPSAAAFEEWSEGNWERICATSAQPLPPNPNDLLAFLVASARVAAAEARQRPPGPAPTPNIRWVCWVRGCRYICTKKCDVGRVRGHWEHHAEANEAGKDPHVERRFWVENWRLLEDFAVNGGQAALEAGSRGEFMAFSQRDRETRELRAQGNGAV